jgi:diadenosine tetraphosphate (Ap4A) HIT family hydrolase
LCTVTFHPQKTIPSTPVYEDDVVYAFRDISPTAPSHIVIIPKHKNGLDRLMSAEDRHIPVLGHLLWAAKRVAAQEGLGEGFRVVINDGPQGCQSVYHLHLHVIGGKQLTWPPGTGAAEGSMRG